MKRRISFLLVSSVMLSLFTLNGYAAQLNKYNERAEEAKAYITAVYENDQFSVEQIDGQAILAKFVPEVRYVENEYNIQITNLDEETLELLKDVAIANLRNDQYRFSDLIGEISLACAQKRFENAAMTSKAEEPKVKIENIGVFRAQGGKHLDNVATGMTAIVDKKGEVVLSAGMELAIPHNGSIFHLTLTGSISESVTYSCEGPEDGATLHNGERASHRTVFGVLFGQAVKHTVTYPDGFTHTFYYIAVDSRETDYFTTLTRIGTPTYADRLNGITGIFSRQQEFYDKIEKDPNYFI